MPSPRPCCAGAWESERRYLGALYQAVRLFRDDGPSSEAVTVGLLLEHNYLRPHEPEYYLEFPLPTGEAPIRLREGACDLLKSDLLAWSQWMRYYCDSVAVVYSDGFCDFMPAEEFDALVFMVVHEISDPLRDPAP